jgi:hypothetical protein
MERRIAIGATALALLACLGVGLGGGPGRVAFAVAVIAMPVLLMFGSARGPVLRKVVLLFGLVTAGTILLVALPNSSSSLRVLALLIGGVLLPWILTVAGVLGEPRDSPP